MLKDQLIARMPNEKDDLFGESHNILHNRGYNQALKEVKEILDKVEVNENQIFDIFVNKSFYCGASNAYLITPKNFPKIIKDTAQSNLIKEG